MKSAKAIKKITSLLLGTALAFTSLSLPGNLMTVNAEEEEAATSKYFKANLFDYDENAINQSTLDLVAAKIAEDGYTGSVTDAIINSYPAIMFHNSGNYGSASSAYYTKYKQVWNSETQQNETSNQIETQKKIAAAHYNRASWNNCTQGYGTKGMVADELSDDGLPQFKYTVADLFDPSVTEDKTSVFQNADVEFQYEDGYYVLDSSKYSYSYSAADNTLSSGSGSSFWIFGSGDYHFGMNLDVDFFMNESGTYKDSEGETQPFVFDFSGDDDVWVYLDDKLALDLGGIHGRVYGSIDFANQQVIYKVSDHANANTPENDPSYYEVTVPFSDLGIYVNDNSIHTLSVFYLERGAGASNCRIKFNMSSITDDVTGDYSFVKEDAVSGNAIADTGFTLYSDEACTSAIGSEVKSGADGLVTFEDLHAGTYYIKETTLASGYGDIACADLPTYKLAATVDPTDPTRLQFTLTNLKNNEVVTASDTVSDLSYPVIYNTKGEDVIEKSKTATLVDWNNRIYRIDLSASAYDRTSLADSPSSITYLSGSVKDVLDSRFELAAGEKERLEGLGATVSVKNGVTEIVWSSVEMNSWTASFQIQAKASYVGGNSIDTNAASSGITVNNTFFAFEQPKVNVKINLTAGSAADEIFLGQSLHDYFTSDQLAAVVGADGRNYKDVNLTYSWQEEGKSQPTTGSLESFSSYIKKQKPEDGTSYELTITASPKTEDASASAATAAEAMVQKASDKTLYTASMQSAEDARAAADGTAIAPVSAKGTYTVTVVTGQITIQKNYSADFLSSMFYSQEEKAAINAKQTAIFTVSQYAEGTTESAIQSGQKPIRQFQVTITGSGSKTITDLPAGVYKVVEEDWTWAYSGNTVNSFYIGKNFTYDRNSELVWTKYDSKTTTFTNTLTNKALQTIYADTTNALNVFKGMVE